MNKIVLSFLWIILFTDIAMAGQEDWVKIGVVPYKSPREVVKLYSPIASILAQALGKNVRVVTADNFEQYMGRVYRKQYDIIVLGSTFYFKAHDRAGYQVVARGYPSFRCGIIVRSDSGITKLAQLRGKSMAAVNRNDRGGYKLQKMALMASGIDLDRDLDVHFRGRHDSVIYAVLNGQDDAGAIRLDSLRKETFAALRKRIRIIYASSDNPQFPFAVRQDLDPDLRVQISETLASITLGKPETAAILQRLNIKGIERVSGSKLEALRKDRQEEEQATKSPAH